MGQVLVNGVFLGALFAVVAVGLTLVYGVMEVPNFAHAGVIGDRRAATHHRARADLAATGATVVHDRVVDDGDLVTSGGVTSGIDMALHLVAREVSPDIARRVAERMEYSVSTGLALPAAS